MMMLGTAVAFGLIGFLIIAFLLILILVPGD